MNNEKQELKNMSMPDLEQKIVGLRKDYFTLLLNGATAHIKDYSQFKKLRRQLAQALTFLNEKRKASLNEG